MRTSALWAMLTVGVVAGWLALGCRSGVPGEPSAATSQRYSPCPEHGTPCVILPLGDSITYGSGSSSDGGYRTGLFVRALRDKTKISFVGSGSRGPASIAGVAFPRQHEGHTGFLIGGDHSGLASITPLTAAIPSYAPHIVTLMIGTNDLNFDVDRADAPRRLGVLLDSISAANPKLLLVVAQLIPSQIEALNARIESYNAALPALVKARADAGKHMVLVDMYRAFTSEPDYQRKYYADPLHPNDAGYARIADVWYAVIAPLLH